MPSSLLAKSYHQPLQYTALQWNQQSMLNTLQCYMLQKLRCSLSCAQVLLGHAYDMAIDMWSLGCMAAELFLGLPLFPGASEHDLLVRIVDMLGMPPDHVLHKAQHTNR